MKTFKSKLSELSTLDILKIGSSAVMILCLSVAVWVVTPV